MTHDDAPPLADPMPWSVPPPRLGRGWPAAPDAASLKARWAALLEASGAGREALFESTRARTPSSAVGRLPGGAGGTGRLARAAGPCPEPVPVLRAPFDEQWLIPDHRLIDAARARDGAAMLDRQLRRVRNNPGLLVLTQTMPVTMLLFFGYVFGSALAMPGAEYRSFLVPGLLAATAANGIMTGMFQAAQDTHRGVTDRLRTLPVSRAAVPLGQSVADTLVTAAGTVPFLLVGLAVGWRIEGSALAAAGAVGLLLLFRFATTWIGILLGLLTRNEEAAGQLGSATFVLPLLSNAYIPVGGLPGWLRTVAEWNPISAVTTALRDLFGNAPAPDGAAWPVAHPVAGSLAWCAVLLAVFVPLAVHRYARGEG